MICVCWIAGGTLLHRITLNIDRLRIQIYRIHFGAEDIFEYFTNLAAINHLPSFEDLESIAKKLFRAYTTTEAQHEALSDAQDGKSDWASSVPLGKTWTSVPHDPTSLPRTTSSTSKFNKTNKKPKSKKKSKSSSSSDPEVPFVGDRVLHDVIALNMDSALSREVSKAAAQGEVGRLWEGFKVRGFIFGSGI